MYIEQTVSNSQLLVFYSEPIKITTYGTAKNWNSSGYFEVNHPDRKYKLNYLAKFFMASPGQCND